MDESSISSAIIGAADETASPAFSWADLWAIVRTWVLNTGIRLVIAIVVLIVSFSLINFISRRIVKKIEKKMEKKKANKTVVNTLAYAFKILFKTVIVISLIAYVGIDVSGITALIASTGVGIGLAIHGALSNIAGGILLIITRPFSEDDFINANGVEGTVEQIKLCHTVLRTPDNKVVYVPNGTLSSGTITNYSVNDNRRLDVEFSIAYSADFDKTREVVLAICNSEKRILKDPAPQVNISEHAQSSLNLFARVWTNKNDYWPVKFDLLEKIKKALDENGIEIPFPQIDVHMK